MKEFAEIVGHVDALAALKSMCRSAQVRQSMLFEGPEGVGKSLIAESFAAHLASNADIHRLQPEGKSAQHNIDAMRALAQQIHLRGFGEGHRVYLIDQAHRMPVAAAHALLKVIEEPPEKVVIILISSNVRALLPTLLSRCTRLAFGALSNSDLLKILSRKIMTLPQEGVEEHILRFGRLGFALRYFTSDAKHRIQCFLRLLEFPQNYIEFRRRVEALEAQVSAHLERAAGVLARRRDWKDLSANVREQLVRNAQAQLQRELQEEWEFFSVALLDAAHRGQLAEQMPWRDLPILQFSEDLQRIEVLWQRGGRLSALIEQLWLTWHLLQ